METKRKWMGLAYLIVMSVLVSVYSNAAPASLKTKNSVKLPVVNALKSNNRLRDARSETIIGKEGTYYGLIFSGADSFIDLPFQPYQISLLGIGKLPTSSGVVDLHGVDQGATFFCYQRRDLLSTPPSWLASPYFDNFKVQQWKTLQFVGKDTGIEKRMDVLVFLQSGQTAVKNGHTAEYFTFMDFTEADWAYTQNYAYCHDSSDVQQWWIKVAFSKTPPS
jgi:hypothetical protein